MGKKSNKSDKKAKTKHVLGWSEWALIGIVVCSSLLIVIALCTGMRKSPQEKAEIELEKLANTYYVEYLYPRLLGNLENDPKTVLKAYYEVGVPTTYLRQLLHYNDDEHVGSAEIFDKLKCDTNATGVKFFPQEPYGQYDYTVKYIWRCEKGDFSK